MTDLFDFIERGRRAQAAAEKARDEALAQVAANNPTWMDDALGAINNMPTCWAGIGEDLRGYVSSVVGDPGHPNAWGALINTAVRRGLLFPTGRYLKMRQKKSHARKTPEYRRAHAPAP